MELSRSDRPGVHFSIACDVKMAHRRVLHAEEDWGYMACRDGASSDKVWLNHVGTFGFASIAYWWARLLGICGRFAGRLILNSRVWILAFADDLAITAGGED